MSIDSCKNKKTNIRGFIKSNFRKNNFPESVLFSRGRKSIKFFTNQSNFYFDYNDKQARKAVELNANLNLFDSLNYQIVNNYNKFQQAQDSKLEIWYKLSVRRINGYNKKIATESKSFLQGLSLVRLWNASILTAVLIGMVSMSFIYRYLGEGVSANETVLGTQTSITQEIDTAETEKWTKEKEEKYVNDVVKYLKEKEDSSFEKGIRNMIKGYPLEKMSPYIAEQDRTVAAFLVAIAKKESNWGKRVPVLNGKDCYNYWGFRAKRKRMGSGGHTCFDSRKDAVDTVAKRIKALVKKYKRDTPAEMVVWKCGYDCNVTGGQAAANKWIKDVDLYFNKFKKETEGKKD